MPSYFPAKKNAAHVFYVSLVSQSNTKTHQANPTLASGDVKVATDDAAPANLTTLPVVDADFTKRVKVSLSASEMNGDRVTVIFSDAAGAEWCDLTVDIATTTSQIDDLATSASITALNNLSAAQVNSEVDTALADVGLTTTITGRIDAAVSTRLATAGYTAPPSVADILAGVIEGTLTLKQAMRLAMAVLAGKSSGGGTTAITFRDTSDSKDRVVATVDDDGNRSVVVKDVTD